jgi:hypothetical protein
VDNRVSRPDWNFPDFVKPALIEQRDIFRETPLPSSKQIEHDDIQGCSPAGLWYLRHHRFDEKQLGSRRCCIPDVAKNSFGLRVAPIMYHLHQDIGFGFRKGVMKEVPTEHSQAVP